MNSPRKEGYDFAGWIENKLEQMRRLEGGITKERITKLTEEARAEINKAYDNFKNTGGKENMNDYFKKLLND